MLRYSVYFLQKLFNFKMIKKLNKININKLVEQYYLFKPKINNPLHSVKFGTSGHRGSSNKRNFNEYHILAITQSIVYIRKINGINGPCFVGKDTHILSDPAFMTVIEVLIGNGIKVITQINNKFTPTPSISFNILEYNKRNLKKSDGIILTSSHNPPEDGGIKYNLPNGGPANEMITSCIDNISNKLISNDLLDVRRINYEIAIKDFKYIQKDFIMPYVKSLSEIINMDLISRSNLKIAIDPLSGSGIDYWKKISDYYKLNLKIINDEIDSTFSFIKPDKDGVIRIDCASNLAIGRLLKICNKFDLLFANDPDCDRHGILTSNGLMNSNDYLAVAIDYLFKTRLNWKNKLSVGKTIVSSSIIDRVVFNLNRKLIEVPVGFKWFVDGLYNIKYGFAGEESGGASFLRFNETPWTTDKDGIVLCLLAAEITSSTGKNPQQYYDEIVNLDGKIFYDRIYFNLDNKKKDYFLDFNKNRIPLKFLAGDSIISYLNYAPGNKVKIGGFKIITKNGWFAVRPSGTEGLCKIYCESFLSKKHLEQIKKEAVQIIKKLFSKFLFNKKL